MRIAYIQGPFPRLCETYLLDQIVNLIQSGHQVDIIASHRADHPKLHPDIERFNLEKGTRYMNLPETRGLQILKAIWLVLTNFHKAPWSIFRSLNFKGYECPNMDIYLRVIYATIMLVTTDRSNYDIIHCQMGYTGLMAVALRRIGVLEGKILTTFHGSDAYVYPHKWKHNVFETLWRDGELNSVGTNYMGNTIKSLGAKPSTIRLLPLGLDLTKFVFKKRVLGKDKTIRLVSVARLVEKKGLEYSIRAFAQVCKTNKDLILSYKIAGEGPYRPFLESLIQELGMQDNIHLLGWQDQPEVARLLADAHIFLFPSITAKDGNKESQALALQEAQAVGLPVVTTIHNGLPEGMLDKESGFLVPEKDVAGLVEKIDYLVTHPETWATMGAMGRRFIESKYEVSFINKKLLAIYDELNDLESSVHFQDDNAVSKN